MNITHISTGLNDGGAEAVLYRLCCHDTENCHTVISLIDAGKYGVMLEAVGVRVRCLHINRSPLALFSLWQQLRCEKPDVVQTWMYHGDLLGGLVARLAGIRRICWGIHHTTLVAGKSKRLTIGIAKLCARLSAFIPQRIICCANKAADVHRNLGYAADKLTVIANGYDLSQFRPDKAAGLALRETLNIGSDEFVVGMVGRFNPQKDHQNLLAALVILKQQGIAFRCLLVGRELEPLQETIDALDLHQNVLLLGQRGDIPAVMNALDVHVLSSSYGEAFPNVLAEAMACGTPCITTDVGDAARIVGEFGWVVPPSDAAALAQALVAAYQARQEAEYWQMRRVACQKHIADNFSIERSLAAYRTVWRETADK